MVKQNNATTKVTTPAAKAQPTTPTVDLALLTTEQITKLQAQLKAAQKADRGDHKVWVEIVDAMLKERDGEGFKHTTSDILSALQAKAVVSSTINDDSRKMHLKRIQTRKQLLEKQTDKAGNAPLKGKVGYKPSTNAFGPLNCDKVIIWLESNPEAITVAQAESITKLIAHIL